MTIAGPRVDRAGPRLDRASRVRPSKFKGRPRAQDRTWGMSLWRQAVRLLYRKPDMMVDEIDWVNSRHPRGVGTEIINICNADCSFCGYGKGDDGKAADPRAKRKLNMDVFRHTLRLYSEAGGGLFTLSPILGEASAHPKWLEMVKEARLYPNITGVACFTNAILLHRFGSEAILTSGLVHINISTCLSSKDDYKRLYGVDQYDQVLVNILDLLETNKRLGSPVDIDLLLRMDKPFEPFIQSDTYKRIVEFLPPSKIAILDDEWDDFRGIIKADGIPKGHQFKRKDMDKSVPCSAMFRKLEVLIDGTIQACACRVEPELWAGNIMEHQTLESAWRNPKLEQLRNDWFEGKVRDCCKTCEHYIPYTNLTRNAQPKVVARKILRRVARSLGVTRTPAQETDSLGS